MRTWLDVNGNPFTNESMIVLFDRHNLTARVRYGSNIWHDIGTHGHNHRYTIYPYDVFQGFIKQGIITVKGDGNPWIDLLYVKINK